MIALDTLKNLQVLDQEQFDMLTGALEDDAAEVVTELLSMFSEDTAPQLQSLETALRDGKFTAAGKIAHALAGSSANLGALRFYKICKAIEESGAQMTQEQIQPVMELLNKSYLETVNRLKAEVESL